MPMFGLNPQARAVLAILAGYEPAFAEYEGGHYNVEIRTYPHYNGREQGVCLAVFRYDCEGALLIRFGEHRSSDSIFVDIQRVDHEPFNAPTCDDFTEAAYLARKFIPSGQVGKAADFIFEQMESFYKTLKVKKVKEAS